MKDAPQAPPPTDWSAQAKAQGAANVDTARVTGVMSNPNINTPYGSQIVTHGPGQFNEQAYLAANPDVAAAVQSGQIGSGESHFNKYGRIEGRGAPAGYNVNVLPDQPTVTQTLNPESQKIFDAQQRTRLGMADLGNQALGTAQTVMGTPFQYGGPSVQTSIGSAGTVQGGPNASQYGAQTGFGGQGQVQGSPNLFGLGQAGAGINAGNIMLAVQRQELQRQIANAGRIDAGPSGEQYGLAQGGVNAPTLQSQINYGGPGMPAQGGIQGQLNTSGVAGMPVNAGMTGQQAIMSRLQPQIERERNQLETQLRNQGLVAGGEAYNNAATIQNQRENDLLSQAALQGVNVDLAANQQGFGQAVSQGTFGNQAQAQGFGQGLQANQQGFTQALQSGQFGNEAQLASFGAGLQNQQQGNAAIAQNFGQGVTAAQLQNQQQQQQYAQNLADANFANQASLGVFGMDMQNANLNNQGQQQGYSQQMGIANLQNQAIAQNQQTALAQQEAANRAQAQQYGQGLSTADFYNQAQQQNFGNQIAGQQAGNAAQNQTFNQLLQSGQFANTAQGQAIAQELQKRQIPLNEITALMSGSQIQNPQFQGYAGANVAQTPIMQGAQNQAAYNQNLYNQQVGAQNANTSGLYGLAGSAIGGYFGGPWGASIGRRIGQ